MRIFFSFLLVGISLTANFCWSQKNELTLQTDLNSIVDQWHLDASKPNFTSYFEITTANFVFLGTAPGERWDKNQFKQFAKPYFDAGKAWDFKPTNRRWIFAENHKIAWFDEDLSTWMNTCRGSGIMVKEGKKWKLAYYNLTVLIENEKMPEFLKLRQN
jgi:hypothetical protein